MVRPAGQLLYLWSRTDRKLHPYAVCATDNSREAKSLILDVSPGAINNLPQAVKDTEDLAAIAARHGKSCVVARPTGCGPGSVYQNYGEVDLLEAIEAVCANFTIARDRITIMGVSMGGAATWYMVSHYPDLFAGAVSVCGYCDYELWEKPGGLTFHMNLWEEPSWISRSAKFLVENLRHTPVWAIHGEWDRSVGGGVSVEHSRQMARLMADKGFEHQYTEVPKAGHGRSSVSPQLQEEVVLWLLDRRKRRDPDHVSLATYGLRHNRSYWVTIEQLEHYGRRGMLDARFGRNSKLEIGTEGVRTFSVGPVPGRGMTAVTVDSQALGSFDLQAPRVFRRSIGGSWTDGAADLASEKRHAVSGPIGDLFFESVILVPGTSGTDEEGHFNTWVANNAARYFRERNGGVHRGGILGQNSIELRVASDKELTEDEIAANNLVLYGTHASNAVLARFESNLPLRFEGNNIYLGDKLFSAERAAVFAVFPHPLSSDRYAAVHGGVTSDAITWSSHLDMMLLPDYIAYSGGALLEWGFWGNDWRSQG